jgi:uncharacterized membrane protein
MRPSPVLAANIWEMMHGGSTHLPIALMLISAVFDGLGCVIRTDRLKEQFHAAGFFTLIAGVLATFPAVLSGLVLARWDIGGTGTAFLASRLHLAVIHVTVRLVGLEADRPDKAIESRPLGLPGVRCFGSSAGECGRVLGR